MHERFLDLRLTVVGYLLCRRTTPCTRTMCSGNNVTVMSPIKQQKACFISIKFYCNCYYYILTYGVDHHHHHQSAEVVL